jgi:hypothetical protein
MRRPWLISIPNLAPNSYVNVVDTNGYLQILPASGSAL